MYSGDGPPSFSSAGINSGDNDQFQTGPTVDVQPMAGSINSMFGAFQIQSTGDPYGQLPSYGALGHGQGNSYNELQDGTGMGYRGIGQSPTAGIVDDDKPPSFTALGHGQGNSHNNQDGTLNRGLGHPDVYSYGDRAPSVGSMGHVGNSQPSGGGGNMYSGGKAPNISDLGGRENSQNLVPAINNQTEDLQALVGMSLVGKNFRKFYPTAYYKEKDEN